VFLKVARLASGGRSRGIALETGVGSRVEMPGMRGDSPFVAAVSTGCQSPVRALRIRTRATPYPHGANVVKSLVAEFND
jgi:hypothetical protein